MSELTFEDLHRLLQGPPTGEEISGRAFSEPQRVCHVRLIDGRPRFEPQEIELPLGVQLVSTDDPRHPEPWVRLALVWGANGPKEPPVWVGEDARLVFSAFPWSATWAVPRSFRSYRKGDAAEGDRKTVALAKVPLASHRDAVEFVEAVGADPEKRFGRPFFTYDFFEERHPCRVASLPETLWPSWIDASEYGPQRALRRKAHRSPSHTGGQPPSWTFGVVEDYARVVDQLSEALSGVALAVAGDPLATEKDRARVAAWIAASPEKTAGGFHHEAAADANALMELSIRQALAGPPVFDPDAHRDVEDFALLILMRHLENGSRLHADRDADRVSIDGRTDEDGAPRLSVDPAAPKPPSVPWSDEIPSIMEWLGKRLVNVSSAADRRAAACALAAFVRFAGGVGDGICGDELRVGRRRLSKLAGFADREADFERALRDLGAG